MQSTNGVQENIGKIQSLFPDCVTETIDERTGELVRKVDFEKLQQNLSAVIISGREERYQFTWPDKKKAILSCLPTHLSMPHCVPAVRRAWISTTRKTSTSRATTSMC